MKISVITVCYNSAATIKDTLASIASQHYKDFEHLIIDGGSTDETLEIVRQWKGHPIRLVSEPDEGLYDAMNKGLRLASGEIVGFLNSDDFYADSSVLGQIADVFANENVDACYADLVYVTQDNRRVVRYWQSKPFVKGAFAHGWCPAHPTFYVRKSMIENYGHFDRAPRLAADVELMMRYLERHQIESKYVPKTWVRMRVGGQTNKSLKNIILQNKEIMNALRKNNVPFSKFSFTVNKLGNRLSQFVFGRVRRHQ